MPLGIETPHLQGHRLVAGFVHDSRRRQQVHRDRLPQLRINRGNGEGIAACVIRILHAKPCSENGLDRHVLQQQLLKQRLWQQRGVHHQVFAETASLDVARKRAERLPHIITQFFN